LSLPRRFLTGPRGKQRHAPTGIVLLTVPPAMSLPQRPPRRRTVCRSGRRRGSWHEQNQFERKGLKWKHELVLVWSSHTRGHHRDLCVDPNLFRQFVPVDHTNQATRSSLQLRGRERRRRTSELEVAAKADLGFGKKWVGAETGTPASTLTFRLVHWGNEAHHLSRPTTHQKELPTESYARRRRQLLRNSHKKFRWASGFQAVLGMATRGPSADVEDSRGNVMRSLARRHRPKLEEKTILGPTLHQPRRASLRRPVARRRFRQGDMPRWAQSSRHLLRTVTR